jgi:Uma2 family endonuclease
MIQTPVKPERPTALEDFLALPETNPAQEFINGKIYTKPSPEGEHSLLRGTLICKLNTKYEDNKIALALPELRCTFGGRGSTTDQGSTIVPDVTVFTWDRLPKTESGRIGNKFKLAPDWTIEILSPGQTSTLVMEKIIHCLDHGTVMGWMLDLEHETLFVSVPDGRMKLFKTLDEPLPLPEFMKNLNPAFLITLGDVLSWLHL